MKMATDCQLCMAAAFNDIIFEKKIISGKIRIVLGYFCLNVQRSITKVFCLFFYFFFFVC